MQYQRSFGIEQRLDAILKLIRTGKHSTPTLADELDVSIPTISRCVTALRERGHDIQAEKMSTGWRYVLMTPKRRSQRTSNRQRADRGTVNKPK